MSGGVRITQHKLPTEKPNAVKIQGSKDNNDDDDDDEQAMPESPPKPMIMSVSGAPVRVSSY